MQHAQPTPVDIDSNTTGWFSVYQLASVSHPTFIIEEPHHSEEVKSLLVVGQDRAVLIDSGMGVLPIRPLVEQLTDKPVLLVNSHAHWDHRGDNASFEDIWIHEAEAADLEQPVSNAKLKPWFVGEHLSGPLPEGVSAETIGIAPSRATRTLRGGEHIDLGGRVLEVVHAPGHSPGGIVLVDRANKLLFSTDVVYAAHLYVDNLQVYIETMTMLSHLVSELRALLPSHGPAVISPDLIPEMRDALNAIQGGQPPVVVEGTRSTWEFGEFGVYMWSDQ